MINSLKEGLRLVPEVRALEERVAELEARIVVLEAPEPALCEEPTGHHPACPHYVPPR